VVGGVFVYQYLFISAFAIVVRWLEWGLHGKMGLGIMSMHGYFEMQMGKALGDGLETLGASRLSGGSRYHVFLE
jgi:hypothetical protein